MTKSKGVGRGGLRSNPGGRPKKAVAPIDVPASEDPREPDEIGLSVLKTIALAATAPVAERVKAAKALVARGSAPKSAAPGKKLAADARAATASAPGGKFAPRPAPKLN